MVAEETAPAWNYTFGDSVRISCFTNCDEAELFLNNVSLGKKKLSGVKETRILTWQTIYQPGVLTVKGYKNTNLVQQTIRTAGEAFAIKAVSDRSSLNHERKN